MSRPSFPGDFFLSHKLCYHSTVKKQNNILSISAFMHSPLPFKSDCCFFLSFAFSVTSFCFQCDKRQLSLFVLYFSSRGRYKGFFCQLHGRCTLLDFKFKFQEFNNKTNSQVHVFLMLVTGQKLLASEQIKYSAFSRTFLVLGNRTRVSSAQTNKMKFFTNPQIWHTRSTFLQSSVLTLIKHPRAS